VLALSDWMQILGKEDVKMRQLNLLKGSSSHMMITKDQKNMKAVTTPNINPVEGVS